MGLEPRPGRRHAPGRTQPAHVLPLRPAPSDEPLAAVPDDGQLSASDLKAALAAGCLEVHYQPVVAFPSRHVVGFEALARLRLPDGRLVHPDRFVTVAERSGLVVPLGEAVLRTAVPAAADWRRTGSVLTTATVSVNVAPAQLGRGDFLEIVRSLLAEHDLPGTALVLEITEHTATSSSVRPVLQRLAALGVRVALDDFGIGFATLDNLRRLPVQVLKLDRSFVAGVVAPSADRAIVRVVIDLADSLGLSVIAEGVETGEQAEMLLRLGCGHVQGNLFAEPGPSPVAVAARVAEVAGPSRQRRAWDDDAGWDPALDAAVLAASRLLADGEDRARVLVHAVATEAARLAGLDEDGVRSVGRLALVHDVHRIALDSALPPALAGSPRIMRLAEVLAPPRVLGRRGIRRPRMRIWALPPGLDTGRHDAVLDDLELHLLLHAVEAVTAAGQIDPGLGEDSLAAGLRAVAVGYAEHCDQVAPLYARIARRPLTRLPLADLVEDLDRRRLGRRGLEERLRSLVGITRVLSSSRDARELLRVTLEEVRRIAGAASAALERWERDRGQVRTLVNVGALAPGETTFPAHQVYRLADYPVTRRALTGGLPEVACLDDPDVGEAERHLLEEVNKHSSAEVPIHLEGRVWGLVWLTTDASEPPFTTKDVELLTAVTTLMASVIPQAEHFDQAARLAFEDPLTRVGNRRALDDALRDLSAAGRPVALVLIDVDRLSRLNDTEGHARGDQALVRVADALAARLGALPGAVVARLGGDEFCCVVPDLSRAALATLVRAALLDVAARGGPTASVGFAEGAAGWQPRRLLAAADAALDEAKGSRPPGPVR